MVPILNFCNSTLINIDYRRKSPEQFGDFYLCTLLEEPFYLLIFLDQDSKV